MLADMFPYLHQTAMPQGSLKFKGRVACWRAWGGANCRTHVAAHACAHQPSMNIQMNMLMMPHRLNPRHMTASPSQSRRARGDSAMAGARGGWRRERTGWGSGPCQGQGCYHHAVSPWAVILTCVAKWAVWIVGAPG